MRLSLILETIIKLLTSWSFDLLLITIIFRKQLCTFFQEINCLILNKDGLQLKKKNTEIELKDDIQKFTEDTELQKAEGIDGIKLTYADINKRYSNELIFSKLKLLNIQINNKLTDIYNTYYNVQLPVELDTVLIFDELRNNEILNPNFCYYIYEYCVIANKIAKKRDEIDEFDALDTTINDYNIYDLIKIGEIIMEKLNFVEQFIIQQKNLSTKPE